ncbi:hypothetical protein RvY_03726 [Ramazzottius varieornatus]|uniref:Uncharacterized protein n=1 Tax=Ramazzottius varieornatus TaxID=947166 RepID=A0A1D1UP38_RAMVA|nr:hypothetical protein RvY_03726 [Ramazzottius varieornatus]
MVRLQVKKGDEDLFLYDAPASTSIDSLTKEICQLHNGRFKVFRMAAEMEDLAQHGIALPPDMVGLNDEQISELNLRDTFAEEHLPSGGCIFRKDELLRRNGYAPTEAFAKILTDAVAEAKEALHKRLVSECKCLTYEAVTDQFMKMKGALMIVYPMGLPLHEPLHVEMTTMSAWNLDAGHGGYRDVMEEDKTALWWAGKELKGDKLLKDFVGPNDKTKVVVKLAERGKGVPGREPVFSEEQKKRLLAQAFQRQQELEQLEEEDDDDHYLNSKWADGAALKRTFQGIADIKTPPF